MSSDDRSKAEKMRSRAAALVRSVAKPWDGNRDSEGEPDSSWLEDLAKQIESLPIEE